MGKKLSTGFGLIVAVVLYATAAYAAPDADAVTAITGGATTVKDTLLAVGTAVLPFAAAVAALGLGWRMARKFVRA